MEKMKIEIALENKAFEQFSKDYLNGVVNKIDENNDEIQKMVMQLLHKGGLSAEEVTFMDCYLVKVMSKKYCEAYNNCLVAKQAIDEDDWI